MPRDATGFVTDNHVHERSGGVAYFCARCGAFMTRGILAMRINGEHDHVVFNPAGRIFLVACFKDAPGAVAVGNASAQSAGSRASPGASPCAKAATPRWAGCSREPAPRRCSSA